MSFLKGYNDQNRIQDLEAERKLKLQSMEQQNARNAYAQDRREQKDIFTDEKRKSKIDAVEAQHGEKSPEQIKQERIQQQYKELSTNSLDTALVETLQGNFTKLKAILTNSTDTNFNKDVKDMLEAQVGGKILDIRQPDPARLAEGQEYAPDDIAVEIITDAGERQIQVLSTAQLGAMVGTPKRIGTDKFIDLASGNQKKQPKQTLTPTGQALKDSITFEGDFKGVEQNLLMAGANGDKNAIKMLNAMSTIKAKDGDTVIKALQTQYSSASPEEKPEILAKMTEMTAMMQQFQKPKKGKNTKEQIQADMYEAHQSGDTTKVKELQAYYKSIYGTTATTTSVDNLKAKNTYEVEKAINNRQNTRKAIRTGDTDQIMEALAVQNNGLKIDQQKANYRSAMGRVANTIDLRSKSLSTGELTSKDVKTLETLKQLEARLDVGNTTAYKDAMKIINSAKITLNNANSANLQYDLLKNDGYFNEEIDKSGVKREFDSFINRSLGALFDKGLFGDEVDPKGTDGMETLISSVSADIDKKIENIQEKKAEVARLQDKDTLTKQEQVKLNRLKHEVQVEVSDKWNTNTYLTLKKMLQSISGMGVTNQELQSFKKAFSGGDTDMLDFVMTKLKASSIQTMKNANTAYGSLMALGAGYSATKGILDMRTAGKYMIDGDSELQINDNLNAKPIQKTAFEEDHPKEYSKVISTMSNTFGINDNLSKNILDTIENHFDAGGTRENLLANNPSLKEDQVSIAIELIKHEKMKANKALKEVSMQGK